MTSRFQVLMAGIKAVVAEGFGPALPTSLVMSRALSQWRWPRQESYTLHRVAFKILAGFECLVGQLSIPVLQNCLHVNPNNDLYGIS